MCIRDSTEAAPKYDEMIYYFLKAGYHVNMPEHMGHGQRYRLTADPSLVHIDKKCIRDSNGCVYSGEALYGKY